MPALRTRDTQSRPLEVSTDGPQPPTLTIISPTPRTFSFPNSHNLSDSPYSTPSSSPFEPDLRSLALTTSSTPPLTRTRTLSPDSISSASPAPSTPKRRKSSTGPFYSSSAGAASASSTSPDALERRPKKGDEDYVKRPENAFILFRRKCCEDRLSELDSPSTPSDNTSSPSGVTKKQRQADLSKTISQQWKSLPAEERQYWERLAKEKKKEHEALYPNYVYRPQRVRDKDGKVRNKKRQPKNQPTSTNTATELLSPISAVTASPATENGDGSTFSFILPPPRQHGRSISAPTPPPMHYRSIQIPTMHHIIASPSCPSSPSLLSPTAAQNPPMISRRATEGFAYEGYEHLVPPAFLQEGSQLQSSEYLRSMFNISNPSSSSSSTTSTETTSSTLIAPPHIQTALLPSPNIISPSSATSTCSNTSSGPISPSHFLSQPEFNPHVHYYDSGAYQSGHLPEYSQFSIDPSTGVPIDFSSVPVDYSKFCAPEMNPHVHQHQYPSQPPHPQQPQPYGNVVEYPEYDYSEYADYAEIPDFQQPEGYTFSWDSENVWPSGTTSTSSTTTVDEFDLGSIPPCVVGGTETQTTPTTTPTPTATLHQLQEKPMTPPQPLIARSLQGVEGGLEIEGPGLDMDMEPMEMELDMEGNAIMSMGMGMGMSMGNGMGFDEMMASGY